ncbi:ABC transporter ATP-binding protein [Alicyclobacillus sp. SO9]|uniref:ABC transporter ATP-binding protein n=1 Tax=Alicyclobacillus sp. SO9 TaxID=2665646 RepID=UPI00351C716D
MTKSVEVRHVHRTFGKKVVLRDISLDVDKAQIFGLLGPSGSGKTTLVRLIAGLDKPTAGTVSVSGVLMPKLSMLRTIGYMAQSDSLYTELTAMENLKFFASLYGLKGSAKQLRINEVLELVQLSDAKKQLVSAYSGGMKRRLSLAISLLHRPRILILDEPTVGIDPVLRLSIWHELHTMSETGTTIIVTTHVMDEAEKCDRLGMIRDGELIAAGSPEKMKQETNSASIEEAFLYYGGVPK